MKTCTFVLLVRRAVWSAALFSAVASFVTQQAFSEPAQASVSESKTSQQASTAPVQQQTAPLAEGAAGGMDFPVMRTLGGFALVISLILIAFFVARKIAPQYFTRHASQKNLKVIETLAVGEKRSVAVIQLGDKCFLIGNTPHQITLLSQLEDSFSPMAQPERAVVPEPSNPSFLNPFRKLYETERNHGAPRTGKEKTIPPDVRAKMRQLREALEG